MILLRFHGKICSIVTFNFGTDEQNPIVDSPHRSRCFMCQSWTVLSGLCLLTGAHAKRENIVIKVIKLIMFVLHVQMRGVCC